MAKAKSTAHAHVPKVRIVQVGNRTLQLRYHDPTTGKEVRSSTKSHDHKEAERQRLNLLRELRRGERPIPAPSVSKGSLSWDDFRSQYLKLKKFRSPTGAEASRKRLDICEDIVQPKRLRDMHDTTTLTRLQAKLAMTRSPHTVRSYMLALLAALNWAHKMGWLPARARVELIAVTDLETHKGRPLTAVEFAAMLAACDVVCEGRDPASWKFLLRGLWHSGLRLGEALGMTWDVPGTLRPYRHRSGHVVLEIPASSQKSKADNTIPTVPEFAALLDEVPVEQRTGFVFSPRKLRGNGRYSNSNLAGRVISLIGKQAGVYVNATKPASAHDLRRSFGQRLADAGVTRSDLQAVMRHKDYATTERYYLKHNAADQAGRIAAALGYATPDRTQHLERPETSQVVD
jgi:integrase